MLTPVRPANPSSCWLTSSGGSPYNAGARFAAERPDTDVVSGVNIPMLIEVISSKGRKSATLESLVKKAKSAGTKGIRSFQAAMNPPTSAAEESKAVAPETPPAALVAPGAAPAAGGTMNIALLRIDSRLIHGQVAGSWSNFISPQTLIAASDAAAHDNLRKTLLLQVAPPTSKRMFLISPSPGGCTTTPSTLG